MCVCNTDAACASAGGTKSAEHAYAHKGQAGPHTGINLLDSVTAHSLLPGMG